MKVHSCLISFLSPLVAKPLALNLGVDSVLLPISALALKAFHAEHILAPFFKCLNLIEDFGSFGMWRWNNGNLERPVSNIRTCLMNPYYI